MTTMKKLVSLILAVMMLLSVASVASAAGTNAITVENAVAKETYEIYKLFDLTVDNPSEPKAFTYTINSAWADFFKEGGAGAAYVTYKDDAKTFVDTITDVKALADAAKNWTGKPNAIQTVIAEGNTVSFNNLDNGYYLVTSTLGTQAMTQTTPQNPYVNIQEKNPLDEITKEVYEDSTKTWGNANDAQIGDDVNFKSTITLVKYTRNVVVHDTMTDGLTLKAESIAIEGLTAGTDYTVVTEGLADGCTFEIRFTDTYLEGLENKETAETELILTYTAVLNEKAVVNNVIVDQENETEITFGDKQSVTSETTTTTHKFNVFKHATGSTENLADAIFQLKKNGVIQNLIKIDAHNYRIALAGEENTVNQFTTVADGDIVIWGVDSDDDYTLYEMQAPEGYNKLADEVKVEVNADNTTRAEVENKSGSVLPETGGIGTTIFYAVGGLLVVMAVVLLITKRRVGEEN